MKKNVEPEIGMTTEFATPSETFEVLQYIAKHYLINAEARIDKDSQHIELQYSQAKKTFKLYVSPLSGAWDELLPEDKLVIRGVVCACENGEITACINQLNKDYPDIKLYTDKQEVILDRVFSMT